MKKQQSIDGFTLRRSGEQDLAPQNAKRKRVYLDNGNFTVELPHKSKTIAAAAPTSNRRKVDRQTLVSDKARIIGDDQATERDIESSLSGLPDSDKPIGKDSKSSHGGSNREDRKAAKKAKRAKHQKRRKIIKIVSAVIALILVLTIGFFVWRGLNSFGNIFNGNPLDIFSSSEPLKMDANGRTNILLIGTSDDEVGHEGSYLTDSIMIISLDQNNNNAYMISIPRDLWVKYDKTCAAGNQGKINALFHCNGGVSGNPEKDKEALNNTIPFFKNITGVDIQYAANVNYTVFRDLVNAVGGKITVDIQSRNSKGLLDSNFDWKCGNTKSQQIKNCPPSGHFFQLPNGSQELDAEHSLYLALARGVGAPTYGLEDSNFDREKNQQLVIKGIMDKASSSGLSTDATKLWSLLESMSNNLRTTFGSKEFKTLIKIGESMKSSGLKSISLYDADPKILATDTVNGQSVVVPSAGRFNYSKIQEFLKQKLQADPAASEEAVIYVYNGGGPSGAAANVTAKLTAKDFKATSVGNTEAVNGKYVIYDLTNGEKSGTSSALSKILGVEVKKVSARDLPSGIKTDGNFVVIVGKEATLSSSSN